MSDTEVQEVSPDGDFFSKVSDLLEKLVPPSSVTITKVDGTTLDLPGAIPARRQVVVFRHMRELLELPKVAAMVGGMSGAGLQDGNVIDLVLELATDPEVMEALGVIFREAYPGVMGEVDPLDVLPLEEVVKGLVPFSERFIKAVGGGLVTIGTQAASLN